MLKKLFKQHNTGIWLGLFLSIYGTSSSFLSMISMAMTATVLYTVSVEGKVPTWFTIWLFYATGVCLVGLIMLMAWKFVIPSRIHFDNWQGWQHQNPARRLLEEEFKAINDRLDKIERKMNGGQ